MFHYQFRSILRAHEKAVANGNADMEYVPVRDACLDEKEKNSLQYIVPRVRKKVQERLDLGWWKGWRPHTMKTRPFVDHKTKEQAPSICLAFAFLDSNKSRLRKSASTIFYHLRTYEPSITFESVLVGRSATLPALLDEFRFDVVRFVDDDTPLATTIDLLFDLCSAPFIVSLAEGWETRVGWMNPFRQDSEGVVEKAVKAPVIEAAIKILEQNPTLLEVWIGDVPNTATYSSNRTSWLQAPWSDGQDNGTAWYRIQSAWNSSALGVWRFGGSIKHRERLARVGNLMGSGVDATQEFNELTLQAEYAKRAASMGFSSAHFCLGRAPREDQDQCDSNPDVIGHGATAGMMWRARQVHEDPQAKDGMVDRQCAYITW